MLLNGQIRHSLVRVIGADNEALGILATREALRLAREQSLDLVEVAPTADPPVCRIIDYGKFRYQQSKKEGAAKKQDLKQIKLTPQTDPHDIGIKTKNILRQISDGDKVQVIVQFRGRQMAFPEQGQRVLEQIIAAVGDEASVEKPISSEGRNMFIILAPPKGKKAA